MSESLCRMRHNRHDFENLDGFDAALWGVIVHSFNHVTAWFWDSSRCTCLKQRQDGRDALVRLFQLFLVLLYCKVCRKGFNDFWALEPADAQQPLAPWTLRLHNRVNGKLNKPHFPERLFVPFYVDTCEEEAWTSGTVSHRWAFWFWSIQYLAALNHPPLFDQADERHQDVRRAMETLFPVMHGVIPSVAEEFASAYDRALCDLLSHFNDASENLHFPSRERAFHFVYGLECRFNSQIATQHQAVRGSIFGESCLEVLEYFESVYRVEAGVH